MTPDEVIAAFIYSLSLLHVDDNGLVPDTTDEDTLQAIGAMSVAAYRATAAGNNPYECALSRLATFTGALLLSPQLGHGPEIVRKWLVCRAEVLDLEIAARE